LGAVALELLLGKKQADNRPLRSALATIYLEFPSARIVLVNLYLHNNLFMIRRNRK
jgi:hypothetical protein